MAKFKVGDKVFFVDTTPEFEGLVISGCVTEISGIWDDVTIAYSSDLDVYRASESVFHSRDEAVVYGKSRCENLVRVYRHEANRIRESIQEQIAKLEAKAVVCDSKAASYEQKLRDLESSCEPM